MMFTASRLSEMVNRHIGDLKFARSPQGLYDPVAYVLSMGGKRLRPVLMLMAYNLYRDRVDDIWGPVTGIEVYHNHTLLHDDVMDHADLRRGKPTVHKVWSENTAILSGDAMLILAYRYMMQCPAYCAKEVLDLFALTSLEICEGQQLDMEFEQRNDVSEAEYLEMIRLKTSVLLAASLKIGALLGEAPAKDADALYDFGMNMGVAFQLKDDLLDVYGDPAVFGKNLGGDILCNKKTYLLIKAAELADAGQKARLETWLGADSCDPQEKIAAVTDLYNCIGVKEWCEQKMADYTARARQSLAEVGVEPARKQELEKLLERLMYRQA